MKTGEGKTLVSTLATYLNSLTAEGVHVVIVNDYLTQCYAERMGVFIVSYVFLNSDGLIQSGDSTIDVIQHVRIIRTVEQLGMENNWEKLKREVEIRRVLQLVSVVGGWRKVWERFNRRKRNACLWERERKFRFMMAALETRRSSIEWKATWQSSNFGLGGNPSDNTEGKAEKQVVVGVGERKRMSRRKALRHVIVLSSDSERKRRMAKNVISERRAKRIRKDQVPLPKKGMMIVLL
ncbi:uncharacterized protein LOC131636232 [Vicia villosa]|uniref:uncharacterized protein LOC131636232 n=1 Tax=Vicia villosa TaxID=3911 RepID=UPI00273CF0A5|nr:uncharacterized protein LOC131636232 [Vicia villosa]